MRRLIRHLVDIRFVHMVSSLMVGVVITGCNVYTDPRVVPARTTAESRDLMIFFDGTANNAQGRPAQATNVLRLYLLQAQQSGAPIIPYYIEGVGNARNPFLGRTLGLGMERRLDMAYRFLTSQYRPDDRIFIFGFSRGAHQARALAGLLAYVGLPEQGGQNLSRGERNRLREFLKGQSDADYDEHWQEWEEGAAPPLGAAAGRQIQRAMQSVNVEFVGLWDTVPGSAFKDFPVGACSEAPGERQGDRYKSRSYPPIRVIAHAVSADEKRSRFRPLFVCEPYKGQHNEVLESWFPGAHSDVGGGYGRTELPAISYNWMLQLLQERSGVFIGAEEMGGDPHGVAHSSIGHDPG